MVSAVSVWFVETTLTCWGRRLAAVLFFQYNLQHYEYTDDAHTALEIAYACAVGLLIIYLLVPAVLYVLTGTFVIYLLTVRVKAMGLHEFLSDQETKSWYGVLMAIAVPLLLGMGVVYGALKLAGETRLRSFLFACITADIVVFGGRFVSVHDAKVPESGLEDYHPDDVYMYAIYGCAVAVRMLYGFLMVKFCRKTPVEYTPL